MMYFYLALAYFFGILSGILLNNLRISRFQDAFRSASQQASHSVARIKRQDNNVIFFPPKILFSPLLKIWVLLRWILDAVYPQDLQLFWLSASYWVSDCLYIAAKLQISDLLRDGPKTAQEIVEAYPGQVHVRNLHRLLQFLAGHGVYTLDKQGRFGLTRKSAFLCSGPLSAAPIVLSMNDPRDHRLGWAGMEKAVETGGYGFMHSTGQTLWEYYDSHAELSKRMDAGFQAGFAMEVHALVGDYDWSSCRSLVDIGGGTGSFLRAIVARHLHLRGEATVLDRDAVVAAMDKTAAAADGISFVAGNFFEVIQPASKHTYILKHILHDWEDVEALQILARTRQVMSKTSRLLIIDAILEGSSDPLNLYKVGMDVQMMATCSGFERTLVEWNDLLSRAHFVICRVVTTRSLSSIIEAKIM